MPSDRESVFELTAGCRSPGVTSVQALWVRDGRLYAGTFGQGVFESDNLGDTWNGFNQDLVGGFEDSQLKIADLALDGKRTGVTEKTLFLPGKTFQPSTCFWMIWARCSSW